LHRFRPVDFLLVQDDPVDNLLMREEFAANKVVNRVHAATDARAALAYLDGVPPFGGRQVPDVVLLDLHLPGGGGEAVLGRLRTDTATAHVPVILLVDSPVAEQIARSRGLPVQGYARKPVDFAGLTAIVCSVPGLGFAVHRR
jgi:CheY-like chemotaxis protein